MIGLGAAQDWVASVPPSVTIPAGATTATVTVTAVPNMTGIVQLWASLGGTSLTEEIHVIAGLYSFTVNPTAVIGGGSVTGTVTLSGAPLQVAGVGLKSGNPGLVSVPSQVTVVPITQSTTFTMTTQPVSAPTLVPIWAAAGTVKTAHLWVLPIGVSLTPASVQGGNYTTGTIALPAPAPSGGTVVSLASSNRAVAIPPATVTVPAGARLVTFAARTFRVGVSTPVTVSAAAGSTTWTRTLTVTP